MAAAKKLSWIAAQRLYVYGFSRGTVVATALAHQIDGMKGALLHADAYDLAKLYQYRELLAASGAPPDGEEQPRFYDCCPN